MKMWWKDFNEVIFIDYCKFIKKKIDRLSVLKIVCFCSIRNEVFEVIRYNI